MKHPRLLVAVSILLVTAGVGAIVFVQTRPQPASPHNTQQVTAAPVATKAVATNTVSIQNYTFSPQVITVTKGRTVIWTNNDTTAHTLIFDDSAIASSGLLDIGAGFSLAFDQVGTFTYHSAAYPDAVGTVIVTDRTD